MSQDNDSQSSAPRTWWQRNALSVLGIIMMLMFALVISVQVAC